MEIFNKFFTPYITKLKENGFLTVCYALLLEALFIGYLGFIGLFTIEMLLPTFVSVRFSLTKFFFFLFLFSFVLTALGRYLNMNFEWKINPALSQDSTPQQAAEYSGKCGIHKKNPTLWIGLLWTIGILLLSLYKFPLFIIPIIILAFFAIGYLFWKILFSDEK